jgi:hypothetical protein
LLKTTMSQANDVWYVRLPDGRVIRAKSTEAVRYHLNTGRLPRDVWVRRTQEEEWAALEEVPAFADVFGLGPVRGRGEPEPAAPADAPATPPWWNSSAAGPATSRDDRLQLQTAGVRGMVEELLNAMDSTLVRLKLRTACLAAVVATGTMALANLFSPPWDLAVWIGAGLIVLIAGSLCSALLTQMTFVELSHARPARWSDATLGLSRNATRLAFTYLVLIGVPLLIILVLPRLPGWLFSSEESAGARAVVSGVVMVLDIILVVLLGPWVGFSLLVSPILVVEDYTPGRGMREWWQFVRQHFNRVLFYEALAAALAGVACLPLIFPVAVLAPSVLGPGVGDMGVLWISIIQITLSLLAGLALTPLVTYLVVANVFVYLNLRYEQGSRR